MQSEVHSQTNGSFFFTMGLSHGYHWAELMGGHAWVSDQANAHTMGYPWVSFSSRGLFHGLCPYVSFLSNQMGCPWRASPVKSEMQCF